MKISPNDISNQQILLELRELRKFNEGMSLRMDSVDSRFDSLDSRLESLDHRVSFLDSNVRTLQSRIDSLDSRMDSVEVSNQEILETMNTFATSVDSRFLSIESEQSRVRSVMVTKDYLDDKLANLHSEIVIHTRREIEKALR